MTIDEAIKHYEEMAEVSKCAGEMLSNDAFLHTDLEYRKECREEAIASVEMSREYMQLAEWLRELQELRDKHWDECRQIAHYDDELKQFMEYATMTALDNMDLRDEIRELKQLIGGENI